MTADVNDLGREHDHPNTGERKAWNTDVAADYPIGPDDAGNAVMHAIGFLVRGWRRLVGRGRRGG